MNAKNHRQNHNFQIAYFLAGSCHTADGAYALLCDLREDRQTACDNYSVQKLKDEAKEIRAKRLLISGDTADQKDGEAQLLELENNRKSGMILYQAALDEIAFIDKCIEAIKPLREFSHLSDAEANEATQEKEWKLELLRRVENFMITSGGLIPADQFETMRLHPAFKTEILPKINKIQSLMLTIEGRNELQRQLIGNGFKAINNLLN